MENQKVQMARRQFRIGDLAKELKVKKFVIRFWEKEFNLKSDRSSGGQRFYTLDDLNIFLTIKDLLYNQGFTIAGAKKQLPEMLAGAKLAPADSFQETTHTSQEIITHEVSENDEYEDFDQEQNDEMEEALEEEFSCAVDTLQLNQEVKQEVACVAQAYEQDPLQELAQEAAVEEKKEICIPARSVPDPSFYEGLTMLKDQLMRLYELLD